MFAHDLGFSTSGRVAGRAVDGGRDGAVAAPLRGRSPAVAGSGAGGRQPERLVAQAQCLDRQTGVADEACSTRRSDGASARSPGRGETTSGPDLGARVREWDPCGSDPGAPTDASAPVRWCHQRLRARRTATRSASWTVSTMVWAMASGASGGFEPFAQPGDDTVRFVAVAVEQWFAARGIGRAAERKIARRRAATRDVAPEPDGTTAPTAVTTREVDAETGGAERRPHRARLMTRSMSQSRGAESPRRCWREER